MSAQTSPQPAQNFSPSEKRILVLLAAVQFVNILDFMMVMPLGPDLGKALGISIDHLGWIGGSYTFAAFLSGIFGSFYLDRMKRKSALLIHLTGLSLATLAATFSTDLWTLLIARVLAGLFGGPTTSTQLAILSDVIPAERRGRALGLVMGAFSLASILGVPVGLELARIGGWQFPFWIVGSLAGLTVVLCWVFLPKVEHERAPGSQDGDSIFKLGTVTISLFLASCAIFASFLLIPNLSGFLQFNVGFPREQLGILYFSGGILSLFSTRLGGIWNDRVGSATPLFVSTSIFTFLLIAGMLVQKPWLHPIPWFALLMLANSLRWISISTLTSKVPPARWRARYMSLLSAAQHLASSLGAFCSTQFLVAVEGGRLEGIPRLAAVSLGVSLLIPPLAIKLQRKIS
jgi:predicted MFS family arabinose efflux permease